MLVILHIKNVYEEDFTYNHIASCRYYRCLGAIQGAREACDVVQAV